MHLNDLVCVPREHGRDTPVCDSEHSNCPVEGGGDEPAPI